MKCHIVAATLTTLILAVHLSEVQCMPDQIRACGKELADILSKICVGEYNTYYQSNTNENSNGTRRKRGITQECCRHSCSVKDLLQYCSGGKPINITELLPVDQSPGRDKKQRRQIPRLNANNEMVLDYVEESNDSINAPPTPPPPRLGLSTDSVDKELSKEPHANLTTKSSGIHSKKQGFEGQPPAIVIMLGQRLNLGSKIVPKWKGGPDSTARSEKAPAI